MVHCEVQMVENIQTCMVEPSEYHTVSLVDTGAGLVPQETSVAGDGSNGVDECLSRSVQAFVTP